MANLNRRNLILEVLGECLWGGGSNLVVSATVLPLLLLELQATPQAIGLIPAIEGGGYLLPQVLGMFMFASRRRLQWNLVGWHYVAILPLMAAPGLVVMLRAHLPAALLPWLVLATFAGFMVSIGAIGAVWIDWIAHLFEERIRGRVLGIAFGGSSIVGCLAAMASAPLLDYWGRPHGYVMLYFIGTAIATASITCFAFVKDPATQEPADAAAAAPQRTIPEVVGHFRETLADANSRAYLIGRFLAACGGCFVPFVAVFYNAVGVGQISASGVIGLGAAIPAASAVTCLALGRLGDQRGHRVGILIGAAAQVLALASLLVPGWPGCLLAYISLGVGNGAGMVAHTSFMLESCPHSCRPAHLTICNLLVGTVAMLAPVLGGAVAGHLGLPALFISCAMFSLAAVVWYLVGVRDPRGVRLAAAL